MPPANWTWPVGGASVLASRLVGSPAWCQKSFRMVAHDLPVAASHAATQPHQSEMTLANCRLRAHPSFFQGTTGPVSPLTPALSPFLRGEGVAMHPALEWVNVQPCTVPLGHRALAAAKRRMRSS